ncbi:MAG: ATP-binding protein [Bdellovibrionales bacterium]|nr:ATP-binding protein [Bdellovibrionales bacterium]
MDRYLKKPVCEDLKRKMVFIGGPRQVGKTTLSLNLAPKKHRYFNWDILEDREFILKQHIPTDKFVIFDEIHKFRDWRNYVKGIYDKHKNEKKILITGSARLDYYRHSGDSLQGRYHYYRLHPLTVKELGIQTEKDMNSLLTLGGFPEPFLSGSKRQTLRWQREYRSRVINEDISSLELSQNLSQMELLLLRLPEFVGSPLSVNSLREDLNLAYKTVAKYLDIFERMYLIYRIHPFSSQKLRAVKKEKKHYHYNWSEVQDEGARFENLIASHLLKWVHFQQDYEGKDINLYYFRDTDKREVDFIITENKKPIKAIECKLKAKDISPHLKYFKAKFPKTECIQVHLENKKEYLSREGIKFLSWNHVLNQFI